jgi:hypothetical protein
MQGAYGGLIIILLYGTFEGSAEQQFFLITQDNLDILTQASQEIIVQE